MSWATFRRVLPWLLAGPLWLSCASPSGPPSWVVGTGSPEAFSQAEYLMATGAGRDLEEASANAKAELARIFSARVASRLELVESEAMGAAPTRTESELLVETEIRSETRLVGAEVPLHWRAPETGPLDRDRVWALAVLPRAPECRRIRNRARLLLADNDVDRAERSREADPFLALQAVRRSVARAEVLDGLEARGRVVGRPCVPGRVETTGALRAEWAERRAALRFSVQTEMWVASGEPGEAPKRVALPRLQERIASLLLERGFRMGGVSEARRELLSVPIAAHLRLTPVERGHTWTEVRWEGAFAVGATDSGGAERGDPDRRPSARFEALLGGEVAGATSHPIRETAFLRARLAGERAVAKQLDILLGMAGSGSAVLPGPSSDGASDVALESAGTIPGRGGTQNGTGRGR